MYLLPRQLGLGDEPQRRGGEGQMMLPCPILLGLEFVPADLRLRIFKGTLSEVPVTTPRDQTFVRGILRGIEQGIRAVARGVASYDHPFGPRPLAYRDGPDALHGKIRGQLAAFSVAHHDLLPHSLGIVGQSAHLVGSVLAQHAQARARPSPLPSLLWYTHPRLAEIDVGVSWHLRRVPHAFGVHIGAKLAIPPVQRIAGQQVKGQAMGLDPFDHLQAQLDLRLKAALCRDAQLCAPLGKGCPKPLFWQEEFAIHHRPQPAVSIGQAGVDPAHIHLAHPAIILSGGARVVRPRLLIRTFIQNQRAPLGQCHRRPDLGLNLVEYGLARPRRVGHKVLQGLSVVPGHVPRHVGKVPFVVHGQLSAEIGVGVRAGVARAGLETVATPPPKLIQPCSHGGDRFSRQAPAAGVMQVPHTALRGLGSLVFRRPLPVLPDKPLLCGPGGAVRPGQWVPRRHGGILRTVSAYLAPSQRLHAGSAPCHYSRPHFSIGDTPIGKSGQPIQRGGIEHIEHLVNVTLSSYTRRHLSPPLTRSGPYSTTSLTTADNTARYVILVRFLHPAPSPYTDIASASLSGCVLPDTTCCRRGNTLHTK